MTKIEYTSRLDTELIKDTPYLTLMVKLWDNYHEYFGENWLQYKGTVPYH